MNTATRNILGTMLTSGLILGVSSQGLAAAKKYEIDPKASKIEWMGSKKIIKDSHSGTIDIGSGAIEFDGKKIKGGEIVINMDSIKNSDLPEEKDKAKLIGHLKSADFFGTDKHKNAKLVITSFKELAPGKGEVSGKLTIKEKTNDVTFPVDLDWKGDMVTAKGKMVVDRTKFDIKYNSDKFYEKLGDKVINDNFELTFDLTAKSTEMKK